MRDNRAIGQPNPLRRVAVLALCVAVVAGGMAVVPAGTAAAANQAIIDGMDGDGTESDPYRITNATELQAMSVNLTAHYVLANDIDAASTSGWNDEGAGPLGFSPVGNASDPFAGSLDGQGHTISGLTINRSGQNDAGLIGVVSGGSVTGVRLDNVSVVGGERVGGLAGRSTGDSSVTDSSVSGSVDGQARVGGLVGYNDAFVDDRPTVANASTSGTVDGSTLVGGLVGFNDGGVVRNSSASGDVTGNIRVAGLVGENDGFGSISNSYSDGTVDGSFFVGGLVGQNSDVVENSSASGDVTGGEDVGGLVGENDGGSISDSFATGGVTGDVEVGGLVGTNDGNVSGSYAIGPVSGGGDGGGLIGVAGPQSSVVGSYWDVETTNRSTSAGGSSLTTAEMTGAAAQSNMTAFDFDDTWAATDGYPHRRWTVRDLELELQTASLPVDGTTQATVTLVLADGATVTATGTADYASGDPGVATVAADGTVEGVAAGTTDITATLVESDMETVSVEEGHTVSGTVLDGLFGVPVEGATVAFDDGGNVTEATTNASGAYDVSLVGGTYNVTATATLANGRTLATPNRTALDLTADTTGFDLTVQDDLLGAGTEDDPYVIANVFELQSMRSNLTAHYALGSDVNASETATWNAGAGFAPVGDVFDPFNGSFDGRGREITGLTINRSSDERVALFGAIGANATVTDVHLRDVSIVGRTGVGALVGHSRGTVANASVGGAVAGEFSTTGGLVGNNAVAAATIENATSTATVTGDGTVGGLVGRNGGTMTDVSASGDVTALRAVGGLVGANWGTVSNGSAGGSVTGTSSDVSNGRIGGFAGQNYGTITDAAASGDVAGGHYAGGLVGWNDQSATVSRSWAANDVSGKTSVGGLVGFNLGTATVSNATARGVVTGTADVGGLVGRNDEDATVENAWSNSSVSGESAVGGLVGANDATVTAAFARGPVAGGADVGGLVGDATAGSTVTGAYWDVNATGQPTSAGGVTGLTRPNVTGTAAETNLTGLDFVETWTVTDGYPRLRWEVEDLSVELTATKLGIGDTTRATPTLSLVDGSSVTVAATADYDSDDPAVATVDADGTIEGVAPGTTSIEATLVESGAAEVDVLETRNVSGTITDGVLNEPVANATITFEGFDGDVDDVVVTTDATGFFEATLLDAPYDITIEGSPDGRTLHGEAIIEATSSDFPGVNITIWDDMAGSGTAADPFVVTNHYELQSMQSNHSAHYVLGNDVNASGTAGWNDGDGFEPIGDAGDAFSGSLDGDGHAIAGLTVNRSGEDDVGLFGVVDGGTVADVHLETVSVRGSSTVGGLVAESDDGTIAGSSVSGEVEGATNVGGLVGQNDGDVSESFATADVAGTGDFVGGLVGVNLGAVVDTHASGRASGDESVGGLVGINVGTVSTSLAVGPVNGSGDVGGLIGDSPSPAVAGAYWDVNATGDDTSADGVGLPTANLTGAAAKGNLSGFDFDGAWTTTDGYPRLRRAVEGLELELGSTTLSDGGTTNATATLSLADGSTVAATTVANYTSGDEGVATISRGTVTAVGAGDAELTAAHAGHDDVASLTVESPDSGADSGGGGGGEDSGGGSDENGELTAALVDGEATIIVGGSVERVEVVFEEDVSGTLEVDVFEALPANVDPLPDDASAVALVDLTVPSEGTDSGATLRLTLDASALGDVDPSDLAIYRYHDGEWTPLDSTTVATDGDEVVLETTTPGFSLFAVGSALQQTTPDETLPADGTETPDDTGDAPDTAATAGSDEGTAPFPIEPVLIAFGLVVVVALGLVASYRQS